MNKIATGCGDLYWELAGDYKETGYIQILDSNKKFICNISYMETIDKLRGLKSIKDIYDMIGEDIFYHTDNLQDLADKLFSLGDEACEFTEDTDLREKNTWLRINEWVNKIGNNYVIMFEN